MKQPAKIRFASTAEAIQYIQDPKNYRVAYTKAYTVWCALPTTQTGCINLFRKGTSRDILTTRQKPYIISGTRGEQWAASPQEIVKDYVLPDNTPLTLDYLIAKQENRGCIDWFALKCIKKERHFACFIPELYCFTLPQKNGEELLVNPPGVVHGCGDFVVCPAVGNKPDLSHKKVVNGMVFADTYNNSGWQAMLAMDKSGASPFPRRVVVEHSQDMYTDVDKQGARRMHSVNRKRG